MLRGLGMALVAGALALSFTLGRVSAQDGGGADNDADNEAVKKAWAELGKPGPEHAELKKMVGAWTTAAKETQMDGSIKETTGKTTYSMVMNDLILRQDYDGEAGGVPFKGVGYVAFNKGSGKYESVWMDTMSTGMAWMNGESIEKGKGWEYKGHWFGPGGMKVNARLVLKLQGDDKQTMEYYMDMGQGEMKSVEIVYTRQK